MTPTFDFRSERRQSGRVGKAGRVLIVGGGASGVLLAAQLLARGDEAPVVTIIERREMLGCGVAYSTSNASHLLNTRVSSMSAFPDDPDHFLNWLGRHAGAPADRFGFVDRGVYGRYMADLLADWAGSEKLRCIRRDCMRIEETSDGVVAHLDGAGSVIADVAVLATGHVLPEPCPEGLVSQPWSAGATTAEVMDKVLIVGSGLTMVDQVMSLLDAGHGGEILAVSRRGLLPQPHEPSAPARITGEDVPLGASAASSMRWVRARVRAQTAAGGNWRDVVDGLRPHMQRMWRAMPLASRRSFLRHGCVWWESHRHRMPPASHARMQAAIAFGQLFMMRGAFVSAERGRNGAIRAQIRCKGAEDLTELTVGRIVDCRGIRRDPEAHATPLFADLLATGRARIDPLRIGLDVGAGCEIIGANGCASERLYAVGPVSRAAFWEITAIPDIREQVAALAARL